MKKYSYIIIPVFFILALSLVAIAQEKNNAADKQRIKAEYTEQLNRPVLVAFRRALDAYSSGKKSDLLEESAIQGVSVDYKNGLDAFDKRYFKNRFCLLYVDQNPIGGGVTLFVISRKLPNIIFEAWMFRDMAMDQWVLRAISENHLLRDRKQMKDIRASAKQSISDPSMGLLKMVHIAERFLSRVHF
jgi:hypothetical protein